jgi:peptide/nickel transport system substrate-binding protein
MRTNKWFVLLAVALLALSLGIAACGGGSSDNKSGGKAAGSTQATSDTGGKRGGTLTVLNQGDFDYADPGAAYYQFDYMVHYVTQRPLYYYKPEQNTQPPTPDLADGPWQISPDAKKITIHIKKGIKFSPPVNREVTAEDVKYGLERAYSANVPNGYIFTYMPDVVGAPKAPSDGVKDISGFKVIDPQTLEIDLTEPTAGVVAAALVLPASAPVPKEYAEKFDKKSPSTYGENQVATGPYMIQNDASGKAVGWTPGREIKLVRNPNWDAKLDFRPAYVDTIDIREGNDAIQGTRKILSGQSMITGDLTVPGPIIKLASQRYKSQLALPTSGGFRYVSWNATKPPFDDPNVRKAATAGLDRVALRQARGGPAIGPVATHFLPPDFPGFKEAGGLAGTGVDFLAKQTGDPAVSAKYFKAAGYPSGKYDGPNKKISMVCDDQDPGKKVCLVVQQELNQAGFQADAQFVPHEQMLGKYCGVPKNEPNVCPNTGWFKDFYDPQTMLDATFNPKNILPENNSNYAQLKNPQLQAAFDTAAKLVDVNARNKAYADIDKMIVEGAPGAPYVWDNQANVRSANVHGVINDFNSVWDLAFTSLK